MRACAYPRVGDACLGVLKGREEPHGQVVSHVQQLIVIVLNGHVPKRLLGVRYYSVGRKETSQDPGDRKNTDIIKSRWLYTAHSPVQYNRSSLEVCTEAEGLDLMVSGSSLLP